MNICESLWITQQKKIDLEIEDFRYIPHIGSNDQIAVEYYLNMFLV